MENNVRTLTSPFGDITYRYAEQEISRAVALKKFAFSTQQRNEIRKRNTVTKLTHEFVLDDGRQFTFETIEPFNYVKSNGREGINLNISFTTKSLLDSNEIADPKITNLPEYDVANFFINRQNIRNNGAEKFLPPLVMFDDHRTLNDQNLKNLLQQGMEYISDLSVRKAEDLYFQSCCSKVVLTAEDLQDPNSRGLYFDEDQQGHYVIACLDGDSTEKFYLDDLFKHENDFVVDHRMLLSNEFLQHAGLDSVSIDDFFKKGQFIENVNDLRRIGVNAPDLNFAIEWFKTKYTQTNLDQNRLGEFLDEIDKIVSNKNKNNLHFVEPSAIINNENVVNESQNELENLSGEIENGATSSSRGYSDHSRNFGNGDGQSDHRSEASEHSENFTSIEMVSQSTDHDEIVSRNERTVSSETENLRTSGDGTGSSQQSDSRGSAKVGGNGLGDSRDDGDQYQVDKSLYENREMEDLRSHSFANNGGRGDGTRSSTTDSTAEGSVTRTDPILSSARIVENVAGQRVFDENSVQRSSNDASSTRDDVANGSLATGNTEAINEQVGADATVSTIEVPESNSLETVSKENGAGRRKLYGTVSPETTGISQSVPRETGADGVQSTTETLSRTSDAIAQVSNPIVNEKLSRSRSRDNFRLTELNYDVSDKTRIEQNIEAIKVLKNISADDLSVTISEEQKLVLSRYSGWGGLGAVFNGSTVQYERYLDELNNLLTPEEFDELAQSTSSAFYTPLTVIDGLNAALKHFGVQQGTERLRVLEPSCGIGNFLGRTFDENAFVYGVEKDLISSQIAEKLYPDNYINNNAFEDVKRTNLDDLVFDVALGNVPFGATTLFDPEYQELSSAKIHSFFIAKTLDVLREGGIGAFVVSSRFLDSSESSAREAREYIADRADFLGAIRLPNDIFSSSNADVMTDLVFFQRHNGKNRGSRGWINTVTSEEVLAGAEINAYFEANPQQIVGALGYKKNRFGDPEVFCSCSENQKDNLLGEITKRFKSSKRSKETIVRGGLPQNIFIPREHGAIDVSHYDLDFVNSEYYQNLKAGQYCVTPDNRLVQKNHNNDFYHDVVIDKSKDTKVKITIDNDKPEFLAEQSATKRRGRKRKTTQTITIKGEDRIKGMITLRDTLKSLLNAEKDLHSDNEEVEKIRKELNILYDDFIKKYGYLSNEVNFNLFIEDPESALVFSLEKDYQKANKNAEIEESAKKSDVFFERVIALYQEPKHANSAEDALNICVNFKGHIDFGYMASLCENKTIAEIQDELSIKNKIFFDPETHQWEISAKYLSGNVRKKLEIAKTLAEDEPMYERNVFALKGAIPPDLDATDIHLELGSIWIPDQYIADFLKYLIDDRIELTVKTIDAVSMRDISLGDHSKKTFEYYCSKVSSMGNGKQTRTIFELIESIVNHKPIVINKRNPDPKGNKYIVDTEATMLAQQKAAEIQEVFAEWIFKDPERRHQLVRIYNDKFNSFVPPHYDGSKLQLPGSSPNLTLRPHQLNAVMRNIQEGRALVDHTVGAGKTIVAIATLMEQKRLGLIKKPLVIVPNHLLMQWKSDIYQLYPDAKVLLATSELLGKAITRERLYNQAALGNWDMIVMTHSSFKFLSLPVEKEIEYYENWINEYKTALSGIDGKSLTRKRINTLINGYTKKVKTLRDGGNIELFKSLDISDLGIDCLVVDEAHEFKNLPYTSVMKYKGMGSAEGSQKALDLSFKVQFIQEKCNGKGIFFLTGTPISNSLCEMYFMQKYLQPNDLKDVGIYNLDAWISTFGAVKHDYELDATGMNYALVERLSGIKNCAELISMYNTFADVVTASDLKKQAEELGIGSYVPRVKGGKPQNVIAEPSAEQSKYMEKIVRRMEHLPRDARIDNPLKITMDARKCGLDYRLIDEDAPDFEGSKVNLAVNNIFKIWEESKDVHGTQLVFCDLSTPKKYRENLLKQRERNKKKNAPLKAEELKFEGLEQTEQNTNTQGSNENDGEERSISEDDAVAMSGPKNFSVYDDIKQKLIDRGVPESEIAFIHDATTNEAKERLFATVNKGAVRVLLGSTSKMGAGMNVQKLLVAAHHLDAPWRPSDLEQRNGRIIRQGNTFFEKDPNFEVQIYYYATSRTYDARMWQTIENKARSIEQFRNGNVLGLRDFNDFTTSESATAAEMKAAATGNPLILQQVQLSHLLSKYDSLKRAYDRRRHQMEDRLVELSKDPPQARLDKLYNDIEIYRKTKDEDTNFDEKGNVPISLLVNGKLLDLSSKDHEAAFRAHYTEVSNNCFRDPDLSGIKNNYLLGVYRGFELNLQHSYHSGISGVNVYVRHIKSGLKFLPDNLKYNNFKDLNNVAGFFTRVNNFINTGLEKTLTNRENDLKSEVLEYEKIKQDCNEPFKYAADLAIAKVNDRNVMNALKLQKEEKTTESSYRPLAMPSEEIDNAIPLSSLSSADFESHGLDPKLFENVIDAEFTEIKDQDLKQEETKIQNFSSEVEEDSLESVNQEAEKKSSVESEIITTAEDVQKSEDLQEDKELSKSSNEVVSGEQNLEKEVQKETDQAILDCNEFYVAKRFLNNKPSNPINRRQLLDLFEENRNNDFCHLFEVTCLDDRELCNDDLINIETLFFKKLSERYPSLDQQPSDNLNVTSNFKKLLEAEIGKTPLLSCSEQNGNLIISYGNPFLLKKVEDAIELFKRPSFNQLFGKLKTDIEFKFDPQLRLNNQDLGNLKSSTNDTTYTILDFSDCENRELILNRFKNISPTGIYFLDDNFCYLKNSKMEDNKRIQLCFEKLNVSAEDFCKIKFYTSFDDFNAGKDLSNEDKNKVYLGTFKFNEELLKKYDFLSQSSNSDFSPIENLKKILNKDLGDVSLFQFRNEEQQFIVRYSNPLIAEDLAQKIELFDKYTPLNKDFKNLYGEIDVSCKFDPKLIAKDQCLRNTEIYNQHHDFVIMDVSTSDVFEQFCKEGAQEFNIKPLKTFKPFKSPFRVENLYTVPRESIEHNTVWQKSCEKHWVSQDDFCKVKFFTNLNDLACAKDLKVEDKQKILAGKFEFKDQIQMQQNGLKR